MTDGTHIPREDLALHAMQALSPEESARVQAHVELCEACREELKMAAGDLAMVAMSVEQQPLPQGARERFLERIAATGGVPQRTNASAPVVRMPMPKRGGPLMWIPWAAVAALLLLTTGLTIKVRDLNKQVERESAVAATKAAENARAQKVLDVLTARAAQHVVLTAAQARPAPSARAVYLASSGSLILQASNLAPVPEGKTYELWIIPANGKAPVPAGLFRPDAAGSASLVLPDLPQGVQAKAFGVTVEKASGAETPTLPIVLSGAAPAPGE